MSYAIAHIRRVVRLRLAEWLCSIVLFNWGWILLIPQPTLTSSGYVDLDKLIGENYLGWLCLGIGALRILALTINGFARPTPYVRVVLSFLSALFWFQVTLSALAASKPVLGLAVYPVLSVCDFLNGLRAAEDAAHADIKAEVDGGKH